MGLGNQGSRLSLTLIIPTVEHRAALFSRALRHLDEIQFPGPIVVSDHSPRDKLGVIASITRGYEKLNIKLLQHQPDTHFLTRLTLCAAETKTPYVHLHADDDFLMSNAIDRLIAELEQRPECVAAMGINLHVYLTTGEYQVLPKTALKQPNPFERLIAQLESFSSVLYALRRREEFLSSLSFAAERCPDVQFWQYLESCMAAIKGQIAVVNDLHYVREVHKNKWSGTLVREKSRDHFPYLILSPEFQPRLAAFRAALIEACNKNGVSPDTSVLDGALIHLLYRGFGVMGLPKVHFTIANPSVQQSQEAMLEVMFRDPNHPATENLRRIFALPRG